MHRNRRKLKFKSFLPSYRVKTSSFKRLLRQIWALSYTKLHMKLNMTLIEMQSNAVKKLDIEQVVWEWLISLG